MKRLTSFVIMLAIVVGLLPAASAAEPGRSWEEVAQQCEDLGLEIIWYPEYEGLMRRYGTDRMLLVQGSKSYLYSLKGNLRLAGPFDAFDYFDPSGLAPACQGWKWGIVDLDGRTIVDFLYASEEEAKAQLAVKTVRDEYSECYDPVRADGSLVEGQYRQFREEAFFVNGVARGKVDGDYYMYVNTAGKQVYHYSCGPQSQDFNADGYAVIYENGAGYNVINAQGKRMLPWNGSADLHRCPWDAGFGIWGYAAKEGIAFFNVKTGEHITEKRFVEAFYTGKSWPGGYQFNDDGIMSVALYEDGELRYKLMDTLGNLTDVERGEGGLPVDPATGKTYLPATGPEATGDYADLREGLVWVNSQGEQTGKGYDLGLPWGFADRSGEPVVPAIFDTVGHFDYGYATVMVDGVYGLLKNPLDKKAGEPDEEKPEAPVPTFDDVPAGSWFEKGVMTCARSGIMVGTGDNTFSPNATLTEAECVMLAYRLFDQAQGGDGAVLKAPENYGYMKLTTGGGFVHQGDAGDYKKWRTQYLYRDEPSGLRLCLHGLEMEVPGLSFEKTVPATVTLNGEDYPGYLKWYFMGQMQPLEMVFVPEDEAANKVLTSATAAEYSGHWWRDLGYTLSEKGLAGGIFSLYDLDGDEASRQDFAAILGRAIILPKRFDVPDIPDVKRDWTTELDAVYALCEAGIVGGVDAYGTFESSKTLTRAEAAVMVARVLDESQRLTTPPKPMPTEGEGYTLTYLMDGVVADDFRWNTYPYYFVGDGEAYSAAIGLLHLDGSYYPLPVEEGSYQLSLKYYGGSEIFGEVSYHREESDDSPEFLTGILNDRMEWELPPSYGWLWPREDGYAAINGYLDERECFLLDENYQVVEQVGEEEFPEWPEIIYPSDEEDDYENWAGLKIDNDYYWNKRYYRMTSYYRWSDGTPATEHFAWCGHIGSDGKGFVEKGGKIYLIQFTQP